MAGTTGEVVKTVGVSSDFVQAMKNMFSQEVLLGWIGIAVKMMVVILAVLILRKVACRIIDKIFKNNFTAGLSEKSDLIEEKRLNTLAKMFKSIVSYVLYFIGIITCLDMVGFSITTIVAGAGIASLAVAFGAQSIVQDLMSGIFIVIENQYAVGDRVQIGGIIGEVKEIGMKTTKILTYDGQLMVISNGQISNVVNYSRAAQRGYVEVGIAYEEDIDRAWQVLEQACAKVAQDERFSADFDETPNVLGVVALADSSVVMRTTFTAFNWTQAVIERELRKVIKMELDKAGVEISYPKLQLMTKGE
ncbi:MAG: mechanosensitive ion channel family protein [Peptococcaceae bacterium]|nr:mechanosensitive ion channel family protein [Peptococcaceae bacterium]